MKKTAFAFAAATLCLLFTPNYSMACGDKLLYLSRIYRHHGVELTTVAVFARPNSLLANAATLHLDKALHEEGYEILLINSERDLRMALQFGVADVMIADISDVGIIQQLASATKIPVIPVFDRDGLRNKAEAKRYVAVIKSPVNAGKCLDALDRAFDLGSIPESHSKAQTISISLQ